MDRVGPAGNEQWHYRGQLWAEQIWKQKISQTWKWSVVYKKPSWRCHACHVICWTWLFSNKLPERDMCIEQSSLVLFVMPHICTVCLHISTLWFSVIELHVFPIQSVLQSLTHVYFHSMIRISDIHIRKQHRGTQSTPTAAPFPSTNVTMCQ